MLSQSSSTPNASRKRSAWQRASRLPAGIALIVLCLFGMVALPYWSAHKSAQLRAELRHTLTPVEITLERLHREVLGMANDMRGFLLSRDPSFAENFRRLETSVDSDFRRAHHLVARVDPSLVTEVQSAQQLFEAWLSDARRLVGVTTKGEREATLPGELLGDSNRSLEAFSARIDHLGRLVLARENELEDRLNEFQRTERSLVLVLGTLAAIVVVYLTWLALALLRAQRLALEERDQLEAVLGSVDSGILLLDRDLRVVVANERARDLLGVPLRQLVRADQRRIVREHLKPRMADPEAFEKRLTYLYDHPDSVAEDYVEVMLPHPRTLARYTAPVRDESGVVFGRIEVYRDVTDVLRRERELAEANERKDRFVATLSHELRTPLTPIFGWIELLKQERDPQRIEQGLEAIRRNVSLEAQLVEDLLDLSKVVNQKLELDFRAIDVNAAVEAAVSTVGHLAEAKGVRLRAVLPHAPLEAVVDETRFIQVIWNLLSNAIKFSPPGGEVLLSAAPFDGRLRVVVEDHGEGISRDFLQHIFKPFEQAHDLHLGRRGGLGIGLALARSLVELHGGEITAESEGPGKGARFTFWMPVAPAARRVPRRDVVETPPRPPGRAGTAISPDTRPAAPADQPAAFAETGREPAQAHDDGARQRVLVVEDNLDTLEAMRILLSSWGYEVTATDNVASALRMIGSQAPDVIISDIGMPHVDGLVFGREVRQRTGGRGRDGRILLVAITGFASAADERRALAAGFDAYLTKPIDFSSLKALLERMTPALTDPLQS